MLYRHGDVILEKISSTDLGIKIQSGNIVLAEGEATGHAHRITSEYAELYETPANDNGVRLLLLKCPAMLLHEEHKALELPAGLFRVRIKRQYSPDGWQKGVD